MTYDELLTKIRVDHAINKNWWIAQALRSVVELHGAVTEIDLEDDEGNLFNADFCATCPDSPEYPCDTIKAIEAVLND